MSNTTTEVVSGMTALNNMMTAINNVFATAKSSGTTIDKPTLIGTMVEIAGLGGASMLTGGAASTAAPLIPIGESLIGELVNFFEQVHAPGTTQAAPAPAPTPESASPPAPGTPAA